MASVFTLDGAYLNRLRARVRGDIASARYKCGETWYGAEITAAKLLPDGRVEATFVIAPDAPGKVTAVELYDRGGARIGEKTVSITRGDSGEGLLYACRFSVFQAVDNPERTGAFDAL